MSAEEEGKGKKRQKLGYTEGSWILFAVDRQRGDPAKKAASFFFVPLLYSRERRRQAGSGKTVVDDPRT